MMLGSKDPNYDACGLFRAPRSHNPAQYSHIVGYTSSFMLISGRAQGLSPTYEQAHVGLDLLTLASLYKILCRKNLKHQLSIRLNAKLRYSIFFGIVAMKE